MTIATIPGRLVEEVARRGLDLKELVLQAIVKALILNPQSLPRPVLSWLRKC